MIGWISLANSNLMFYSGEFKTDHWWIHEYAEINLHLSAGTLGIL